jgi:hypothetical protein
MIDSSSVINSAFYSPDDCRCSKTGSFRPLPSSLRNAPDCYQRYVLAIGILLAYCRPSAVFFRVVAVIVNSIYRVFLTGPLTHVCQKVFKRLPSRAVSYPATTIVLKPLIVWVSTSVLNVGPGLVFWSYIAKATLAMSQIFSRYKFPSVTSAAASPAKFLYERCPKNRHDITTLTLTVPPSSLALYSVKGQHCKSTKNKSCQISLSHINSLDLCVFPRKVYRRLAKCKPQELGII